MSLLNVIKDIVEILFYSFIGTFLLALIVSGLKSIKNTLFKSKKQKELDKLFSELMGKVFELNTITKDINKEDK